MKKLLLIFLILALAVTLPACRETPDPCELSTGNYSATGDYEKTATPYLHLNFEDYSFHMKEGKLLPYAERGSFTVKEGKIIATSKNSTFTFEIKDEKTVILTDTGDSEFFSSLINTEFVRK